MNVFQKELEDVGSMLNVEKKSYMVDTKTSINHYASALIKLAKACKDYEALDGKSAEDKALVWQWLETRLQVGDTDLLQLLQKLNKDLLLKVFLVGNQLTVVDFAMFCAIKSFWFSLGHFDKHETFCNVSRWLAHIQQFNKQADNFNLLVSKSNSYN